ncbi:ketoacyl-ACP synthase III family protein [Saccharothrix australiensis]|uniref:3-oxoacyl-[acyl-carrier-protein] synthase-3 n=1 Tax=Saccharothrix australiensis TaxID=2072 RepID=A0A495W1V9_9PSEU|nr:ketoacyl-ACP synthase III family protein [Saccharothrix australiensis]RKT55642.1 3-oxoacyl-[acyl-carrier-protein] synthase-3 [Saccharothrix australiensis]
MKVTDVHLAGLGSYLPEVVPIGVAVAQGAYSAEAAERTGLTGAAVAGEVPAPDMALTAARRLFERTGHDPAAVGLLLYADAFQAGPEGWFPHAYLQANLVGGEALAAGVRQGCNGVFGALELAAAYLGAAGRGASALITAADNMTSPLVDRWQCLRPDFILGDGATAVLLTRAPGFARLLSVGSVTVTGLEGLHRGDEPLHPPGAALGRPLDFAARFAAFAARGGMADAGLAVVKARGELLDRVLAEAGVEVPDLARVLYNHGSREYVENGLLGMLGLPLERSNWAFGRGVGHLGAGDQLMSLDHLLTAGELGAGDRVLLVGLGPGVTIAAAVLEITATPPWSA